MAVSLLGVAFHRKQKMVGYRMLRLQLMAPHSALPWLRSCASRPCWTAGRIRPGLTPQPARSNALNSLLSDGPLLPSAGSDEDRGW
jgi:hypothetical protein